MGLRSPRPSRAVISAAQRETKMIVRDSVAQVRTNDRSAYAAPALIFSAHHPLVTFSPITTQIIFLIHLTLNGIVASRVARGTRKSNTSEDEKSKWKRKITGVDWSSAEWMSSRDALFRRPPLDHRRCRQRLATGHTDRRTNDPEIPTQNSSPPCALCTALFHSAPPFSSFQIKNQKRNVCRLQTQRYSASPDAHVNEINPQDKTKNNNKTKKSRATTPTSPRPFNNSTVSFSSRVYPLDAPTWRARITKKKKKVP